MSDDLPDFDPRLKDDLTHLYGLQIPANSDIDRAILNRARAHFAGRNRFRLLLRIGGAAAAVAAVVMVSIVLLHKPSTRLTGDYYTRDGDTNNDGVVDIRDALALARKVESGPVQWTRWEDLNHDKIVDRKDVDAIAMAIVQLDRGAVR